MFRWLVALVLAAILSVFAALLLHGQYMAEGPVILALSAEHGVHRGDIVIGVGWLIGMIGLVTLVWDRPGDRP